MNETQQSKTSTTPISTPVPRPVQPASQVAKVPVPRPVQTNIQARPVSQPVKVSVSSLVAPMQ